MRKLSLPALIIAAMTFAVWLSPIEPISLRPYDADAQVTCGGLPYTFVDGTIALAAQVNANYTALRNCINNNLSQGLVSAATNAALQGLATTASANGIVFRLGYTVAGDAPVIPYLASASACSLNGGNGDNGSQVKSANGKCWLAIFPDGAIDPSEFGGVGNGIADDSVPLAAAIAGAPANGGKLRLASGKIYKFLTPITLPAGVSLDCGGTAAITPSGSYNAANAAGGTLLGSLTLTTGNRLQHCTIVNPSLPARPATQAAALTAIAGFSGTGITMGNAAADNVIQDVLIVGFQTCISSTAVGRLSITDLKMDCINGFSQIGGGADIITITNAEAGNYFAGGTSGDNNCLAEYRGGTAYYFQDNGGSAITLTNATAVGFQTGADFNGANTTLYQPRVIGGHFDSYYYFGQTAVADPCTGNGAGTAFNNVSKGLRFRGTVFGARVAGGTNLVALGVGISIEGSNAQVDVAEAQFQSNNRGVVYGQGGGGALTGNLMSDGAIVVNGTATGSISGTTLTVTGVPLGGIAIGDSVSGASVTADSYVIGYGTGAGGAGTYTLNHSTTVGSESLTIGHSEIAAVGVTAVRSANNQFYGSPVAFETVSVSTIPNYESVGDWDNFNSVPVFAQGTWTPTLVFSGGNGTLTYTSSGSYRLMAPKMVFATGAVTVTAIGTGAAGNASIGGLPFTVSNSTGNGLPGIGTTFINTMSALGTSPVGLQPSANTATALLLLSGNAGATNLTISNFQTNSVVNFSLLYPRI